MNQKVDFPQNAQHLSNELLEKVQGFDTKALYWLSGYCSGIADARHNTPQLSQTNQLLQAQLEASVAQPVALKTVVLYGSQTGNAQSIAENLHQALSQKGIDAELVSTADFKANKLKEQQVILVVASTHGEGEPPDDAIDFHEFIRSKRAPKLADVQHAVLSLGDSSYEFFCQTGKDFDQALTKLGSKALVERVDCDLDYAEPSQNWIKQVVEALEKLTTVNNTANSTAVGQTGSATDNLVTSQYTRDNPFTATILDNQKITGRDSVKHINHIEISLEDSGIVYEPGDSLGIWPKNNLQTVQEILATLKLSGEENVTVKSGEKTLLSALTENLEVSLLTKDFIREYAILAKSDELNKIAESEFSEYIKNHQVIDVVLAAPAQISAQQLVDLLKPIKPRLYSISSSLQANPEEVHITVGLEESENEQGTRFGTASYYLLESLAADDEVLVYIDKNKNFKLPVADKPVIMIGPGTGIAPFRAFLQERQETEANGANWLFFGNPNFNTDFLYQVELQAYLKDGLLNQLSVAFSRDQAEKIYVQDRLLESAAQVWQWINEQGAYLYVCGDMNRMAKDVNNALIQIIQSEGGLNQEDAEAYLSQLRKDKRYQRDVY
ncbi:assimilatory sulfite reductase (NADPH) flavoprotein subunit [Aliikangiella maris]|uniref:Sulfite reductase [NADPH] flavoprotein alpha-component n=2 Tax=Aliikangiella maris TaxID=3162458 RepID=A0ABV3MK38_9GAMM